MYRWLALLITAVTCINGSAAINVSSLSDNGILRWQKEIFSGESDYQVLPYKNQIALRAKSNGTASGLVLKKKIDLLDTPYINWSWLTESKLTPLAERSKEGDDYVARIYVAIDGGLLVWRTKSLNYVWSSNQVKGQVWDNPFAGSKVKMISIRGKEDQIGQWYGEKRHVYQDLIKYFGDKGSDESNIKAYQYIDIIAIMTDTDNSGSIAESYYGDIIFTAK